MRMDDSKGHVPVRFNDPAYIAERQREKDCYMPVCGCSNCDQSGTERLFNYLSVLKSCNFDRAVLSGIPVSVPIPPPISVAKLPGSRSTRSKGLPSHWAAPCPPADAVRRQPGLQSLARGLETRFKNLFDSFYSSHADLEPDDLFGDDQVWQVCKNYERLLNDLSLDSIMGDEILVGTYLVIMATIRDWMRSDVFTQHQIALRADEHILLAKLAHVQAEEVTKQAKKLASDRKKEIEAQEKAKRARIWMENREAKRCREDEKKAFWAREAVVLAEFKRQRYGESHSVCNLCGAPFK